MGRYRLLPCIEKTLRIYIDFSGHTHYHRRKCIFSEFHENGTYTVQNTLIQLKNAKVFSFSIRCVASDEFRLLLCQTLDYPTTFCYWIIIGGNGKSSIRKCSHGIPLSWDVIDDECRDQQAFYDVRYYTLAFVFLYLEN